jgi:Tfp pilus assembly protein PilV
MAVTRKANQQRGFTLMEAMVAAIVLATGLLSVLSLFAYSLSNLQMLQEDLIARAKGQRRAGKCFQRARLIADRL